MILTGVGTGLKTEHFDILYGRGRFHHVGFKCGFMGYKFKVINYNSDTFFIHINEKEIV